uniref:Uncharacterized protein n=1 Tax=Arundo donax TaxID=35708 RepID=A0A0A9A368_ARUDO
MKRVMLVLILVQQLRKRTRSYRQDSMSVHGQNES